MGILRKNANLKLGSTRLMFQVRWIKSQGEFGENLPKYPCDSLQRRKGAILFSLQWLGAQQSHPSLTGFSAEPLRRQDVFPRHLKESAVSWPSGFMVIYTVRIWSFWSFWSVLSISRNYLSCYHKRRVACASIWLQRSLHYPSYLSQCLPLSSAWPELEHDQSRIRRRHDTRGQGKILEYQLP